MELHSFLCEKRKKAGLTQKELAEKLDMKTYQMVSNWERGTCEPPMNKLMRISSFLSIEYHQLFKLVMKKKELKAKRKAKIN